MKVKVCVLQFEREDNFKRNIEKCRTFLDNVSEPDFVLLGGEFSLKESKNVNPYPSLKDIAIEYNCNIVAPINATPQRFPDLVKKGYSSTHIFNRQGEVVAIQDKQHFYWKERSWFSSGSEVRIFNVDGLKVGLVRGLDLLYPEYTRKLKEAELLFVSTMATDDMMFNLVKVRAMENQSYIIMSSYIGRYVGLDFVGNAAIIEPNTKVEKGIKWVGEPRVLKRISKEGSLEAVLDIEYLRKVRKNYPIHEL